MTAANEVENEEDLESQVSALAQEQFGVLSEEEKGQLSKVLFPETHTCEVTLLGKVRELRPVPIKVSRKLHSLLTPMANTIRNAFDSPKVHELNEDSIKALCDTAITLSEFYGWEDVLKEASDDGLSLSEVQSLAVTQQELNGNNDFLLGPLRIVVNLLRMHEILNLKFQTMCITQPSSETGDAPSPS